MPEAGRGLNRDPGLFAREGYCVFPRVFDDAGVAGNRRLLDEATEAGALDRPSSLGEPHAGDDRWLDDLPLSAAARRRARPCSART